MDETNQGGVQADAWLMARAGFAIDSFIDRELNRPQIVYDQSQAYGVADNGALYMLGRPSSNVGAVGGGGVNGTLILVGIVLLVVLASKG